MKRASPIAVLAVGLLAGCAVGPNFKGAPPPVSTTFVPGSGGTVTVDEQQRLVTGAPVAERWWRLFGSAKLDALVDQALRANTDLKVADASLRQVRAQLGVARAGLLPAVDASYQAERTRAPATLSPPLAGDELLYSLHTAQVSITYPLDLFGGVRRGVESARAQAESAAFQYEAARLSVATNTVLAAIEEASLRAQLAAAEDNVASARQLLAIFERRQALGDVGAVDVAGQRTVLAQAEQALPPLRKALDQRHAALSVLLGREPAEPLPPLVDLNELTLSEELPLTLPSDLVRQRPDIRAAEADLHAASANVGVAIAARLPSIALNGTAGGTATHFGEMFPEGGFWSLVGGIVQPIFHGGALLKQQRVAEAGLDKVKAQYRGTVLAAFEDVANTLSALQHDADGLKAARVTEQAADETLHYARRDVELGNRGTLDVLNAQIAFQTARSSAIQARAACFADTVALFQSLGGGWWNRSDPTDLLTRQISP